MVEVKVLIEGYAREKENYELASSTTVLIKDKDLNVIVDPGMTSGIKYCERCHVVTGKRWDTFYRIPPCGTVAEIEEGGQKLDCVGCHMPEVVRSVAEGMEARKGRKHLFWGGHHPEMVEGSLKVEYEKKIDKDKIVYIFTLTNIGAAHYLPTGTPDRYLTLELKLMDNKGKIIKEKIYKMKRYILWRPLIVEIKDTRLPYGEAKKFNFEFKVDSINLPSKVDVTVIYHRLDEKRRHKIGYKNEEPIAYSIYRKRIGFEELY